MERLTPQEEAVMLHVWQLGECAIKDVVDRMEEPKPPYTTVASIFKNLERKNYLTKKRYGNVKVFRPKVTEAVYKQHFLSGVVKSYFDNSYKELVSFFAKEQKITKDELEEIIRLIEKNQGESKT
ncbi:MAG TPA: BlaI/MecI/CopY family transcriptional regulator [Dysgonamonadaceae bacterium]|jgi:predicted transcriptional regulator|uniref:BlaI/MecI/CopY family transcriptional regulator n=1 Tax=Seramator thermalis TaxID=2496270 RepID=UPI00101E1B79|nr:BlaI/MecI/CopY family transcriptional regulator [Seramator thermalis]MBZ4657691.1 putative transcriptional regulator [Methermicoccus sp.]MBZ4675357.1 putative transcriptional regulator [Dysgonamonadaceae bacterium]HOM62248.1 BlaI/MecI/CopY family transcriptional regulator [Dysgonamonadaceae bacterium]HOT64660.1 BlaI/MecI/CopY family transcriptional regulator [Dysgonamonadaceae bacterium]HOV35040.1 BlaI/MecI/CopY family transcriptional regulator [Dysgonamonadaceae bacterium]